LNKQELESSPLKLKQERVVVQWELVEVGQMAPATKVFALRFLLLRLRPSFLKLPQFFIYHQVTLLSLMKSVEFRSKGLISLKGSTNDFLKS
jgi:hypothetical protein